MFYLDWNQLPLTPELRAQMVNLLADVNSHLSSIGYPLEEGSIIQTQDGTKYLATDLRFTLSPQQIIFDSRPTVRLQYVRKDGTLGQAGEDSMISDRGGDWEKGELVNGGDKYSVLGKHVDFDLQLGTARKSQFV